MISNLFVMELGGYILIDHTIEYEERTERDINNSIAPDCDPLVEYYPELIPGDKVRQSLGNAIEAFSFCTSTLRR